MPISSLLSTKNAKDTEEEAAEDTGDESAKDTKGLKKVSLSAGAPLKESAKDSKDESTKDTKGLKKS